MRAEIKFILYMCKALDTVFYKEDSVLSGMLGSLTLKFLNFLNRASCEPVPKLSGPQLYGR